MKRLCPLSTGRAAIAQEGRTITLGLYRAVLGPRGQILWDKWQEQKGGSDLERLLTMLGTLMSLLNGSCPAHCLGSPEAAQANHQDTLFVMQQRLKLSQDFSYDSPLGLTLWNVPWLIWPQEPSAKT